MSGFGLYVHVPFCGSICPYCAFASEAGRDDLRERYVAAVCREIRHGAERGLRGPLHTVYLGGGTPSRLTPPQVGALLQAAAASFGLSPAAEITIEANPDTADVSRFRALRQAGCNRLSLGVQSFSDAALRRLGRAHDAACAEQAFAAARRAGFDNLSVDLIFAVPGVPPRDWHRTLERAVALSPEHVSAYSLTIEADTPLARRAARGRLQPLAEEEEVRQYQWAAARLVRAGYEHYEVSNFARSGRRSQHNWGYWVGAQYLGVGAAAHSYVAGRRSWNTVGLDDYLALVEADASPCAGFEPIDPLTALRERVWMGLRTTEGIGLDAAELGCLQASPRFGHLRAAGYLGFSGGRLRVGGPGFLIADGLAVEVSEILESRFDGAAAALVSCAGVTHD